METLDFEIQSNTSLVNTLQVYHTTFEYVVPIGEESYPAQFTLQWHQEIGEDCEGRLYLVDITDETGDFRKFSVNKEGNAENIKIIVRREVRRCWIDKFGHPTSERGWPEIHHLTEQIFFDVIKEIKGLFSSEGGLDNL